MAEGTGNGLFSDHFAGWRMITNAMKPQWRSRGSSIGRRFQYPGRAEEQASTDRATEGQSIECGDFRAAFELADCEVCPLMKGSHVLVFTAVMRHLFVFICDEIQPTRSWRGR
jgi:hypothetical protein